MNTDGWKRVKLPDAAAQGANNERPRILRRGRHGERILAQPRIGSLPSGSTEAADHREQDEHERRAAERAFIAEAKRRHAETT